MKNLTINGANVYPFKNVSKNQTMVCVVESGEKSYLLLKTDNAYYQLEMDKITEEEFNSYFEEDNSPT